MKISKVQYETLENVESFVPFDMKKKPGKQKIYLRPVTWLLSFPEIKKCNLKINYHNMEGIKGPYIILCNHNSFIDFKVLTKAIYPQPANYIVAIDGFINRENLLRNVGCICKRKFLNEMNIVYQIKYSLEKNKYICALYPEARYSHVGTTAVLPKSLGKMAKLFHYPVVTLICHGNHLRQPVWNLGNKRKVDITADMTYLISKEDTTNLSVEEINKRINDAFVYDDYKYQQENHILITEPNRAEGLERVLYKCPHCLCEEEMRTEGSKLICDHCHAEYELQEQGSLKCLNNETKFDQIPSWYEWERQCVRKEIEQGTYNTNIEVDIDDLRNSKGFYRLGRGRLLHTKEGLQVVADFNGKEFKISKSPLENYSVHVEYAYFGRGDSVSVSNSDDTYYMFPTNNKNIVTKIHFAVEEIFKLNQE